MRKKQLALVLAAVLGISSAGCAAPAKGTGAGTEADASGKASAKETSAGKTSAEKTPEKAESGSRMMKTGRLSGMIATGPGKTA